MGGNCALIISRKRKCSEDQDSSYERRKSARDDDGNYFYYQVCGKDKFCLERGLLGGEVWGCYENCWGLFDR